MDEESKAVLVTGGAGYIGSHTCKALARAGYTPVAYDSLEHGHRWAVKWGPLVEGDTGDSELLRKTIRDFRVSAVIHFAAYCYVGESMTAPEKYLENNAFNAFRLLEAMRSEGVSEIVFSSTCSTYGMPVRTPIDEDHPQVPINPYGDSKLVVEKMLRWYAGAHGLRSAALRYFNAAGADADGETGEDHEPETHLIPNVIRAALGVTECVEIFGTDYPTRDGTAVRDYIHVTDLAAAHVAALRVLSDAPAALALNLGTGDGYSVREVISAVEKVAQRRVPVREVARRPGDPPELVAAAGRARAVLGWAPRHSSLAEIVETAWRWHTRAEARPGARRSTA